VGLDIGQLSVGSYTSKDLQFKKYKF
jgi:hypothetical protein